MTIRIFNPEHDIALASGLANFTAPHAGRQLRHDLGFLPAAWAAAGDVIVADDPELAQRLWQRMAHRIATLWCGGETAHGGLKFVSWKQLATIGSDAVVEPWGWDSALCAMLLRHGIEASQLPSTAELQTVRELSHRRVAAALLPALRIAGTAGEAFECRTADEVDALLKQYGHIVIKAPWSSSGRGLRFFDASHPNNREQIKNEKGWLHHVIESQGSVMVEPYYNKVKDFGMEFFSDGKGTVSYLGLSLFHTANGAYTGNILATETVKREMISRYVPEDLLDEAQAKVCIELGEMFNGKYRGPFGIDMMACAPTVLNSNEIMKNEKCLLHPCVEINLRRTMGHVAIALTPKDDDIRCVMRIGYSENNYKLTIDRL